MTDIYQPSLRLRPSEQRWILLLGDLITSVAAVFGAIYVWYRYSGFDVENAGLSGGPRHGTRHSIS
jgi:hypothetical protein